MGDAFVLFLILEALASFQSKRQSPPALVMLVFGGEECSDKRGKLFLTEVVCSCPSVCGRMDECFSSISCGVTYLGCDLPLLEVTRKKVLISERIKKNKSVVEVKKYRSWEEQNSS